METALKLKIKHLYNRERVIIIVLFKGNNQFLFIQMMNLGLGLISNSSLNKAETVRNRNSASAYVMVYFSSKVYFSNFARLIRRCAHGNVLAIRRSSARTTYFPVWQLEATIMGVVDLFLPFYKRQHALQAE